MAAALPACQALQVQLLAVGAAEALQSAPDGVVRVEVAATMAMAERRAIGLQSAEGDLVLFASDVEAVERDWNAILLHRLGVVSGEEDVLTSTPTTGTSGA